MTEPLVVETRPQSVRVAVIAYMIGAALGIVVLIISLATIPLVITQTEQIIRSSGTNTQGVDASTLATTSAVVGAVIVTIFSLVFSILTFVFARKMGQGRNWARITLLVFAVLQLFGVTGAFGAGFLHFAAFAVGAIFSFLPTSSAWFRAVSPRRTTAV